MINDIEEKIKKLKLPRNFITKPVLVHASDITADVSEENYFVVVINAFDWIS